jgi:hypothetical protein
MLKLSTSFLFSLLVFVPTADFLKDQFDEEIVSGNSDRRN